MISFSTFLGREIGLSVQGEEKMVLAILEGVEAHGIWVRVEPWEKQLLANAKVDERNPERAAVFFVPFSRLLRAFSPVDRAHVSQTPQPDR